MAEDDRTVDLNAARAARAEAQDEPVTIIIGADVVNLAAELDFDVLTAFSRVAESDGAGLEQAARALFVGATYGGDEEAEDFGRGVTLEELKERNGFSLDDFLVLLDLVLPKYGLELPPSQASPARSRTTSAPSRPTSGGTTGSTSGRRSGSRAQRRAK